MSQSGELQGVCLNVPDDVWFPRDAAAKLIDVMIAHSQHIQEKTVLDVGCGSGILGIKAGLLGASHVIMSDANPSAVQCAADNWRHNLLSPHKLSTYHTPGFCGLPPSLKGQIDLIVCNPPMQPFLETDAESHDASLWNETGQNGREVFDQILLEGPTWLNRDGTILVITSSRHDHRITHTILNTLQHDHVIGSWQEIVNEEMPLLPFQQKYISVWQKLDAEDGGMRVFKRHQTWFHRFIILKIRVP